MFHFFHKWKIVAASNRNQPVYRDPANPALGVEDKVTTPKTDVLYKCKCGKLKSVDIAGTWSIRALREGR